MNWAAHKCVNSLLFLSFIRGSRLRAVPVVGALLGADDQPGRVLRTAIILPEGHLFDALLHLVVQSLLLSLLEETLTADRHVGF